MSLHGQKILRAAEAARRKYRAERAEVALSKLRERKLSHSLNSLCWECGQKEVYQWGWRCSQCQRSWDEKSREEQYMLPEGYRLEREPGFTFLGNVTYRLLAPDGDILAKGVESLVKKLTFLS